MRPSSASPSPRRPGPDLVERAARLHCDRVASNDGCVISPVSSHRSEVRLLDERFFVVMRSTVGQLLSVYRWHPRTDTLSSVRFDDWPHGIRSEIVGSRVGADRGIDQ